MKVTVIWSSPNKEGLTASSKNKIKVYKTNMLTKIRAGCSVSRRNTDKPYIRFSYGGFRVVRSAN